MIQGRLPALLAEIIEIIIVLNSLMFVACCSFFVQSLKPTVTPQTMKSGDPDENEQIRRNRIPLRSIYPRRDQRRPGWNHQLNAEERLLESRRMLLAVIDAALRISNEASSGPTEQSSSGSNDNGASSSTDHDTDDHVS